MCEIAAHLVELVGIRPLKTVNRLFAVADGKNGAAPAVFGDKKLFADGADDRPLVGRSVLRFVNQDVVDAAVEFEQYPAGGFPVVKQPPGKQDHVVVVHQGMRLFIVFVTFGQFSGKNDDGFGGQKNPECFLFFGLFPYPCGFFGKNFRQPRVVFQHRFGGNGFVGFAVAAEESAGIVGKVFRCGILQSGGQFFRPPGKTNAAFEPGGQQSFQLFPRQSVKKETVQFPFVRVGCNAQPGGLGGQQFAG